MTIRIPGGSGERLRILIGGEYSGTIRDAFIARGHDAMSCDFSATTSPGPHYQGDWWDFNERNEM